MIVEGWSLDVYCDNCDASMQTGGATKGLATKKVTRNGWYINRKRDIVLCETCRHSAKRDKARIDAIRDGV